ncbi:beta-mannosidase [Paenibacillus sp. MMO-177]|uniref:beta-mannosidase n=1 Tax=Paenibacillus sp. MMO-177 TaxID=3081289 RepID=UPI003016FEB5
MLILDLNGNWSMRRWDETDWTEASVPGSVYNDLMNAGKMEDPYYRENDREATKISEHDYVYRKVFSIHSSQMPCDQVLLRFEGLDTLAEILLNGHLLACTNNMHRTYEFDVKDYLRQGENELLVTLRSPLQYIREKYKENPIWSVNGEPGFPYIRKAHHMFGWDWGPNLPDLGIWRGVSIIGFNDARLEDVYVTQHHANGRVGLDVKLGLENWSNSDIYVEVVIRTPDGQVLNKRTQAASPVTHLLFDIENPKLWWPNGFGEQPLYKVQTTVFNGERQLDGSSLRIGLRTISVTQNDDEWGRSFSFCVNGVDIFAMGADYIPEDNIIARMTRDKTARLLKDCVDSNFNCIRVWGGAYFPEDYFYDLCDEYGLLVWQDLLFACAVYDFTDEFRDNVVAETEQNMKRIRHHACLGLWCGNNENEWAWVEWDINQSLKLKADYIKQFEVVLPEVAKRVDPNTFYWRASPSSLGSFDRPNDENFGDMHDWSIWHHRKPFTDFRNRYPRFMSEFGLQAFPGMKTIHTFALPEDLNIFSNVIENHQKHPNGIEPTVYYLSQYFKFPKNFESFPYVSQLIQAEGVRYGVEHWRRNRGRCMGAVYWQLNDSWPVASWASIDYYGRWKALQYAAKRFFAPVLLSVCEEGSSASLHLTNETMNAVTGYVVWRLRRASDSAIAASGEMNVEVEPLSSMKFKELSFEDILCSTAALRSHYLEYEWIENEGVTASGTTLFVKAKEFELPQAHLSVTCEEIDDEIRIKVYSDAFAMFVELDLTEDDAVFSDNYFHLSADQSRTIVLDRSRLSRPLSLAEIKEQLTCRSLSDSY